MPLDKPATIPTWATGTDRTLEPSAGKKVTGYVAPELPSDLELNWLIFWLCSWIAYIDEQLPVTVYGGNSSDGAFTPVVSATVSSLKHYSSGNIPVGVVITLEGPSAGQELLEIFCSGDWDIYGTLQTTGGGLAGGAGGPTTSSNGSAGTGMVNPPTAGQRTGGGGALGAPGSFSAAAGLTGGAGAGVTDGAAGPADGGPHNPRAAAAGGIAGPNYARLPYPQLLPGTGGGGGSAGSSWAGQPGNSGGVGGRGAAAVWFECGGTFTIHPGGVLKVAGAPGGPAGTAYVSGIAGAPGGDGGGAPMLIRCANYVNNGTVTEGTGKVLVHEF